MLLFAWESIFSERTTRRADLKLIFGGPAVESFTVLHNGFEPFKKCKIQTVLFFMKSSDFRFRIFRSGTRRFGPRLTNKLSWFTWSLLRMLLFVEIINAQIDGSHFLRSTCIRVFRSIRKVEIFTGLFLHELVRKKIVFFEFKKSIDYRFVFMYERF